MSFKKVKNADDLGSIVVPQCRKKRYFIMSKAVWFISYKLVKGASVQDFLLASKQCHNEVLSKKKGFISWKLFADGDTWVDLVEWKTMEDAVNAEKDNGDPNPVDQKFYSFINPDSLKMQTYSIEKKLLI